MRYSVITADCHVNEPPDTHAKRVPARLRDRVPRVEASEESGERWGFDDVGSNSEELRAAAEQGTPVVAILGTDLHAFHQACLGAVASERASLA